MRNSPHTDGIPPWLMALATVLAFFAILSFVLSPSPDSRVTDADRMSTASPTREAAQPAVIPYVQLVGWVAVDATHHPDTVGGLVVSAPPGWVIDETATAMTMGGPADSLGPEVVILGARSERTAENDETALRRMEREIGGQYYLFQVTDSAGVAMGSNRVYIMQYRMKLREDSSLVERISIMVYTADGYRVDLWVKTSKAAFAQYDIEVLLEIAKSVRYVPAEEVMG